MNPFRSIYDTFPRLASRRWCAVLLTISIVSVARCEDAIDRAVDALRNAGAEGAGFDQAIPAASELRKLPASQISRLLDGTADVNPVAANWFRGVVFDVTRNETPDLELLREYAMNRDNNPIGRGLAMELIAKQDSGTAERLIDQCLDDPSLPLREMAVERAIEQASKFQKEEKTEEAIKRYREALGAARHPRQLSSVVEALEELGEDVSVAEAFALITRWHAAAPFDNVDGVGFAKVYPPEAQFVSKAGVDLDAKLPGKHGMVSWQVIESTEGDGVVDLASAYDKEKGAVAYLYAEFDSSKARPAQVRLGCTNANKIWLNGKEVTANEVYHSGNMIDQYISSCDLVKGTNRVLLKICQNEQDESWAQEWEFQFRITDPTGKGLVNGE